MEGSPIIIVGAGAAGLMAARELLRHGKKVIILEARDRLGGRIHTVHNNSYYVEAGAEFVHGNLPLTIGLLKEYHIEYRKTAGVMTRIENGNVKATDEFIEGWDKLMHAMKELKTDMPLADFLSTYFGEDKYKKLRDSVIRFAEGYDVADVHTVSTLSLYEEWTEDDDAPQYRIEGGYEKLINALADDCKKMGYAINLSSTVKKIAWKKDLVKVYTHEEKEFTGNKLILTVPLGIFQSGTEQRAGISFSPSIPIMKAAHGIGFGTVIKILLKCKEPFWGKKIKHAGFIISDEMVPTWWTQLPNQDGVLTGWLGGIKAKELNEKTDDEILDIALHSLANIFQQKIEQVQSWLIKGYVFNWEKDPFALGAYSFPIVQTKESRKILNTPVEDTIFFSGEALYDGPYGGTVEAALTSGLHASQRITGK